MVTSERKIVEKFLAKYYMLAVCVGVTIYFVTLSLTMFRDSLAVLFNSGAQLLDSVTAYFRFLFFLESPAPKPIAQSPDNTQPNILPHEPRELGNNLLEFFERIFNGENFTKYFDSVGYTLTEFARVLPFIVFLLILLQKVYKRSITAHNNDYNRDTLPLKAIKTLSTRIYTPIKRYSTRLCAFIFASSFPKIWLVIWLFNLNIFAVMLSAIASLLLFAVTLNFTLLYDFIYNSVACVVPVVARIPFLLLFIFVLLLADRYRKRKGLDKLCHMENMNKGFILDRSICTMLVGTMGKGKTTIITDMALSTEAIFREKAYELMLECDLKFPQFPWIIFENELKRAMESGKVFNLATASEWVGEKTFYYDHKKYGMYYNDKKTLIYLHDTLRDYAKLYFVYVTASSLILSNYAIRTDAQIIDNGNMPLWNCDFFNTDARLLYQNSRRSHILDFDMLRLGKKMVENNKNSGVFEFGVIAITETGKERGNQYKEKELRELIKEMRKNHMPEVATQLTDKFNESLKLIRHKCTVMGFPFARVFLDEQRPESLGADARDLCEIVHIRDKSNLCLAMPFFFIGELIHACIFPRFKGVYQEYRFNRGDNTLFMFALKKVASGVHSTYWRTYNRFGYRICKLAIEESSTGQIIKESKYFLATKKIYSNRFSTDAYGDIFAKELKNVAIGLNDIPTYATDKATENELKSQNSYFINDICKQPDAK